MADQLIKCSRCKCNREPSAFKVNKKGGLLKTCMVCNERKRDKADTRKADLADDKTTDLADDKTADRWHIIKGLDPSCITDEDCMAYLQARIDEDILKKADAADNKKADIADVKVADLADNKKADIADVKVAERGRARQRKIADEYRDTRVSSRAEDELFTMLEEMMPPGMDWGNRTEWYIGFDIDINALDKGGHLPREDEVLRRLRMHNLRPMWLDPSAHK